MVYDVLFPEFVYFDQWIWRKKRSDGRKERVFLLIECITWWIFLLVFHSLNSLWFCCFSKDFIPFRKMFILDLKECRYYVNRERENIYIYCHKSPLAPSSHYTGTWIHVTYVYDNKISKTKAKQIPYYIPVYHPLSSELPPRKARGQPQKPVIIKICIYVSTHTHTLRHENSPTHLVVPQ